MNGRRDELDRRGKRREQLGDAPGRVVLPCPVRAQIAEPHPRVQETESAQEALDHGGWQLRVLEDRWVGGEREPSARLCTFLLFSEFSDPTFKAKPMDHAGGR